MPKAKDCLKKSKHTVIPSSKEKVLIVASVASMISLFNIPNIRLLEELGYDVDVAANFRKGSVCTDREIRNLLRLLDGMGVDCYQVGFERDVSRLRAHMVAFRQLDAVMKGKAVPLGRRHHRGAGKYAFIHAHSPIGGAIGRIVAKLNGARTIYTAHGFHFYDGAPLKNWLLYYPVERGLSWITDVLVTINKEDYRRAKRKFHAKRTVYVPGVGVDTQKFHSGILSVAQAEEKRSQLGLNLQDIMLLSVGELIPRKNHEAVVRAIAKIGSPNVHYFIAGKGRMEGELQGLIQSLGVSGRVQLLGFRTDISELCQAADLFVLPSHQEGVSLALMEAIACKTPVVCSRIRGNTDLVKDTEYLFDPYDLDSVKDCLGNAIKGSREDIRLRMARAVQDNYKALRAYGLSAVEGEMARVYGSVRGGVVFKRLYALTVRRRLEEEYHLDAEAIVLLSAGELNENKNHAVVIKALEEVKESSPDLFSRLHYFVAGKGELGKMLKGLAKELGAERHFHLLGFREDVPGLLAAADIFLLPSRREGLNVSLMEAVADGLPCIASNIRGNRDLIAPKYLANPTDAREWSSRIQRLCGNLDGKTAESVMDVQQFGLMAVGRKMKGIYKSIGDSPGGSLGR